MHCRRQQTQAKQRNHKKKWQLQRLGAVALVAVASVSVRACVVEKEWRLRLDSEILIMHCRRQQTQAKQRNHKKKWQLQRLGAVALVAVASVSVRACVVEKEWRLRLDSEILIMHCRRQQTQAKQRNHKKKWQLQRLGAVALVAVASVSVRACVVEKEWRLRLDCEILIMNCRRQQTQAKQRNHKKKWQLQRLGAVALVAVASVSVRACVVEKEWRLRLDCEILIMNCRRQQTQAKQRNHKKEWQLQRLGAVAWVSVRASVLAEQWRARLDCEILIMNCRRQQTQAKQRNHKKEWQLQRLGAVAWVSVHVCVLAEECRARLDCEILIMNCRRQQTQAKQRNHKKKWQLQRLGAVAWVSVRACVLAKECRARLDCEILIMNCRRQQTQAKQRNHKKEWQLQRLAAVAWVSVHVCVLAEECGARLDCEILIMNCRRQQTQAKQRNHKKEWQLRRLGAVARVAFRALMLAKEWWVRLYAETLIMHWRRQQTQAKQQYPKKEWQLQRLGAAAQVFCFFLCFCVLAKERRVRLDCEILIMHCRRQQTQAKQQYPKKEWQLQRLAAVAWVSVHVCVLAEECGARLDCEILIMNCRRQQTQAKQRNHKKEWQLRRLGAVARVAFRALMLAKEWWVRLYAETLIMHWRRQQTQAKQQYPKKEWQLQRLGAAAQVFCFFLCFCVLAKERRVRLDCEILIMHCRRQQN